jgi:hypothetical protein
MLNTAKLFRILAAVFLAFGGSAHATFHLWQITQLYSNADGTVQYVELMAYSSGQQYIAGHTITAFQGSNSHTYTFPSNLNDDTAMMSEGGYYGYGMGMPSSFKSMLLATRGFADLNVVTPDFIIPDGFLFTTNGRVDWSSGPTYDSLSYAALPTDGTNAMFRSGMALMNSPLNFDGFSGIVVAPATANYTDLWWAGESESGWGVNLNHQSDTIFATLFTYAADHSPLWLVATMKKQLDGSYTGDLYQTTGPAFNASPWTAITPTIVGKMSTNFTAKSKGTLVYDVNGTGVTKDITREAFGTAPTCTFTSASRVAAKNYQDLWWHAPAETESGWGVNFTHHDDTIVATLFTYAANGKGLWLIATMAKQADGSFSGDLLRTTGPAFNTTPWTSISFVPTGTMRVAFSDGENGTLTYTVDGVPVTKAITREVFGTPSVCTSP